MVVLKEISAAFNENTHVSCSSVGQQWTQYSDGASRYLRYRADLAAATMGFTLALAFEMMVLPWL